MIYGHSRYVSTCMWKGQYPLCYLKIDGKARPNNIHTNIQEPTNESVFECISLSISKKKRYWYIETILFWCIFQIWRSCLTIAKYKDWQELVLKQLIKYHESTLKYFSWYRGIYCWWFFPLTILLFPTSKALVDRWFGLPTKNAISCFFSLKFN